MRLVPLLATVACLACKPGAAVEPTLVGLANRLYLAGTWDWSDSVSYAGYTPSGSNEPHFGWYVVSGTATLEDVDSTDVETYALSATAQIFHVDSVGTEERQNWVVMDITYEDTVFVRGDSIHGLSVETIPPEAGVTTNSVSWIFSSDELWCTNWLTDSLPAGNTDNCSTVTKWTRAGAAPTGG